MTTIVVLPSNIHVFSGKEKAKKLRRAFHLAYLEKHAASIIVNMPEDTYAFSRLFIKTLMGEERNIEKYQWISTNPEHQAIINQHLRLLRNGNNSRPTLVERLKNTVEYTIHAWECRKKCHTN